MFHRNILFSVLDLNLYNNEMPVARPRFSTWHSIEKIERSAVDR